MAIQGLKQYSSANPVTNTDEYFKGLAEQTGYIVDGAEKKHLKDIYKAAKDNGLDMTWDQFFNEKFLAAHIDFRREKLIEKGRLSSPNPNNEQTDDVYFNLGVSQLASELLGQPCASPEPQKPGFWESILPTYGCDLQGTSFGAVLGTFFAGAGSWIYNDACQQAANLAENTAAAFNELVQNAQNLNIDAIQTQTAELTAEILANTGLDTSIQQAVDYTDSLKKYMQLVDGDSLTGIKIFGAITLGVGATLLGHIGYSYIKNFLAKQKYRIKDNRLNDPEYKKAVCEKAEFDKQNREVSKLKAALSNLEQVAVLNTTYVD